MEKNEIKVVLDAMYSYLNGTREDATETKTVYTGYNFVNFDELLEIARKQIGTLNKNVVASEIHDALNNDARFVKSSDDAWDINRRSYSMADVAYFYLKELKAANPAGEDISLDFQSLFDEVTRRLNINATEAIRKKGAFYTNLTLDGRFIILGNYKWDLRENHKFEDCPDINAFYDASDDEEIQNRDVEEYDDDEKEDLGIKKTSDDEESTDSDRSEE